MWLKNKSDNRKKSNASATRPEFNWYLTLGWTVLVLSFINLVKHLGILQKGLGLGHKSLNTIYPQNHSLILKGAICLQQHAFSVSSHCFHLCPKNAILSWIWGQLIAVCTVCTITRSGQFCWHVVAQVGSPVQILI